MSEEHAVSLKLPTFWSSQHEVWFAQAEAQFNLRKITADTKYYYVLVALDQPTATRLLDLISHPPTDDKYTPALSILSASVKGSEHPAFFISASWVTPKPSVLMDETLALLEDHTPCFLFKQRFLKRPPPPPQKIYVSSWLTQKLTTTDP